jgi:ferredoxin
MLEFAKAEFRANSRLSCQLKVTAQHEGLVIRLPDLQ